jgi:hypothetical protein
MRGLAEGSADAPMDDATLLSRLHGLVERDQSTTARLLGHLGDVDVRGLYRDVHEPGKTSNVPRPVAWMIPLAGGEQAGRHGVAPLGGPSLRSPPAIRGSPGLCGAQ